jgi:GGDEF domain-containing protein
MMLLGIGTQMSLSRFTSALSLFAFPWLGSTFSQFDATENSAADKDVLCVMGEKMLRTARRLHQPLSVIVLQLYDLPELELVFGPRAAQEVVAKTMAELIHLSPRKGFAAHVHPDTFALLMPHKEADAALLAVEARLGKPCALELNVNGEELVLLPEVMVDAVAGTESVQEAYERLCRDIAKARLWEQRRQKYLRRERESHTRPVDLYRAKPQTAPKTVWDKRAPAFFPQFPATIAMPMGAR